MPLATPPPQMFLFESRITATTTTMNFWISNKDQVPINLIPCAQFVVVFLVMRFVSRLDELLPNSVPVLFPI